MDEGIIRYYRTLERHIGELNNIRTDVLAPLEKARRASETYDGHKVRRNRKKTPAEIKINKSAENISFQLEGLLQARQILYMQFPELQKSSSLGVVVGTGSF